MNAYDMADLISSCKHSGYNDGAATLLRQQANRIAELEKELNHMQSFYGCDPAYYGMKQSEPVAWAKFVDGDFWDAIHSDEHTRVEGDYTIPLYTTPHHASDVKQTKPLSDDDVEEFEWMLKKYFNYKPDAPAPNLNRIIRAIEAKVRGQ